MNIYKGYVRAALQFGYVAHVERLIDKWGGAPIPYFFKASKTEAAWFASEALVNDHGYHRCPGCTWAVKKLGDHLTLGTWCEEEVSRQFAEELRRADERLRVEDPERYEALQALKQLQPIAGTDPDYEYPEQ